MRQFADIQHAPDTQLEEVGHWPEVGADWELYRASELPEGVPITTAAGVAIRDLLTREVVLTYNMPKEEDTDDPVAQERAATWELPGGHLDLLTPDGPWETWQQAVLRESVEEAGFHGDPPGPRLFAYRIVINRKPNEKYPPVSCNPFGWMLTSRGLSVPTEPNAANGTFLLTTLESFVTSGSMQATEARIAALGVRAARLDLSIGKPEERHGRR